MHGYLFPVRVDYDIGDHLLFEGLNCVVAEFEDGGSEGVAADSFGFVVFDEKENGWNPLQRSK